MRRGVVFLNNRHHDPTLATFISVDPLVIVSGDAYTYGHANPIYFSDPTGLIYDDADDSYSCDQAGNPACEHHDRAVNPPTCGTAGSAPCNGLVNEYTPAGKYSFDEPFGSPWDQFVGGFLPGYGEILDIMGCLVEGDEFSCAAAGLPLIGGQALRRGAEALTSAGKAPRSAVTNSADDWWRASNVGPNRAGTLVPESFDLSVAGQKFSVHPNATKHMAEYATSTGGGSVPISSFAGSVEQAVAGGLSPGRNFVTIGRWELGIDTNSNVIYHAVYRP